ncbi:hypothetical protein [Ramlibacter alkalitolerans]|jgi:hypothetical protein|uniref:Flagellar protein FliT n=1 Tax=Ramlibacter alkalitolerans TaxID=2039631 RepID=A0ABS1JQE1_9BURK|nr:hypothetical protein [Ramlibacter alkalitolerans]MBL0426484.1 hypothetical protein [Ramlibacter alkalitolerans]
MISHSPEQAAVAAELARQLTEYEDGLRTLLQGRWDPELYRALSNRFDELQMKASALPLLSASWTELLITRVELTHALWTLTAPCRVNGRVVAYHARHQLLIDEVRRQCGEYMATGERVSL